MARIGFVGLGQMGLPICANLVAAGYVVTAGDARAELERAVMQCGVQWHAALAKVAAGADILITMLPGSREEREVMAGPAACWLSCLPQCGLTWPAAALQLGGNSPLLRRPAASAFLTPR